MIFKLLLVLCFSTLAYATEDKAAFPYCKLTWEAVPGNTPGTEQGAKPQGLVWHEDYFYFSNHFNDTKSLIYKINAKTLKVESSFTMPKDIKHAGGLAIRDNKLLVADYLSNTISTLDLNESFQRQEPIILGQQKTTLKGTSGLASYQDGNSFYLAVSDFLIPYFPKKISRRKTHIFSANGNEQIVLSDESSFNYKSGRYSQGLTFSRLEGKVYLIESLNALIRRGKFMKKATDLIRIYDFEKLKRNEPSLVAEFDAPAGMVEDLAWNESTQTLWTSDESTYKFYQGKFVSCP